MELARVRIYFIIFSIILGKGTLVLGSMGFGDILYKRKFSRVLNFAILWSRVVSLFS